MVGIRGGSLEAYSLINLFWEMNGFTYYSHLSRGRHNIVFGFPAAL